jgi:isochorismate synthase
MASVLFDLTEATALCRDAVMLARFQRDARAYAIYAVQTTLPENPTELFTAAKGQSRSLLWHGDGGSEDGGEWLLSLGQAWHMASDGPGRGTHSAEEYARLESRCVFRIHGDESIRAQLPLCFTAWSFEETPPGPSHWGEHLPGAQLWLPQRLYYKKNDGTSWIIAACAVHAQEQAETCAARLMADVKTISEEKNTPTWPTLGGNYHDEVEDAIALIRDGALRKVVLSRATDLAINPLVNEQALMHRLRRVSDKSTLYAHDLSGNALFAGITPELLFSASGDTIATMALAGTSKRGANESEDSALISALIEGTKERKEHGLVVEHLVAALRQRCLPFSVPSAPHPRILNRVIHLQTTIQATLRRRDYLELLAALHPTPAVCGLPTMTATHYLARREKLHRGLFSGALGFISPAHARIIVPLRGGIIREQQARLFAGAGIIETSIPQDELAETELKLSVMRQVLS